MIAKRKKSVCGKYPEDISVLLQMVLDKAHITEEMVLEKLSEGLEIIVGPLILPHVKIERLDKGILTLKCDSSAWKQELFLQKKAIIEKCNLLLGKPVVKNILFI
jgi:predicted nucleic acid-binding Zn ribbon protein